MDRMLWGNLFLIKIDIPHIIHKAIYFTVRCGEVLCYFTFSMISSATYNISSSDGFSL